MSVPGQDLAETSTRQVGAVETGRVQRRVAQIRAGEPGVIEPGSIEPGAPQVGAARARHSAGQLPRVRRRSRRPPPGRPPSGKGGGRSGFQPTRRACKRLATIGCRLSSRSAIRRRRRLHGLRPIGDPQGGLVHEVAGERPGQGFALRAPRQVVGDPVGGQQELDRSMADQAEEGVVRAVTAEVDSRCDRWLCFADDEGLQAVAFDALRATHDRRDRRSSSIRSACRGPPIDSSAAIRSRTTCQSSGMPSRRSCSASRRARRAITEAQRLRSARQQVLDPLVLAPGGEREVGQEFRPAGGPTRRRPGRVSAASARARGWGSVEEGDLEMGRHHDGPDGSMPSTCPSRRDRRRRWPPGHDWRGTARSRPPGAPIRRSRRSLTRGRTQDPLLADLRGALIDGRRGLETVAQARLLDFFVEPRVPEVDRPGAGLATSAGASTAQLSASPIAIKAPAVAPRSAP